MYATLRSTVVKTASNLTRNHARYSRSSRVWTLLLGFDKLPAAPGRRRVQNRGRFVDYDQMISDAWGGVVVSKHTVAVTVGEVKKTLR